MKDQIDSKLITALQQNAQATAKELADMLGLSPSQAARRRQRL
ncbi:MAG: AsnC family protein, partial [Lentibacter algarum]